MGRALALREPHARRIEGTGCTGWLRGFGDTPVTVIVVPGLPGPHLDPGHFAARGMITGWS